MSVLAAGLLAGCGSTHAKQSSVAPTSTVPTTSRPVAPTPTTTAPSKVTTSTTAAGPTRRYADVASAVAATYTDAVWCGPLESSSGHSLAILESSINSGLDQLASLSTPTMIAALEPKAGQISASPTARPSKLIDMATAAAIVPVGANPSLITLHTAYCFAALQPLTGYQVTVKGGADVVDMETAYSLTTGGHTTWWHLWWQPTLSFVGCGQSVCLNDWTAPSSPLIYWAEPQRSTTPKFVVPAPNGAWQLSYPPS